MSDNSLKVAFDYNYPDVASFVVYKVVGGGYFGSTEVSVIKVITGEKAIKLYSELTGKPIIEIHKEAGYTEYEKN